MNEVFVSRVVIAAHGKLDQLQLEAPAIFEQSLVGQDYGESPVALVLPNSQFMGRLMMIGRELIEEVEVTGVMWPQLRVIDLAFWVALIEKAELNAKRDVLMVLVDVIRANALVRFLAEYKKIPAYELKPDQSLKLKFRHMKSPISELISIKRTRPIAAADDGMAGE